MHELLTYTDSDFTDLAVLMQELSGNIVFTRDSLDRMLADPNSHLYVIREGGRKAKTVCQECGSLYLQVLDWLISTHL